MFMSFTREDPVNKGGKSTTMSSQTFLNMDQEARVTEKSFKF